MFITLFLTDSLVFDNVVVVELFQDVDFTPEVTALLLSALWFQGLYCHQLPCPVPPRVIPAQLHLSKMPLSHTYEKPFFPTQKQLKGWTPRHGPYNTTEGVLR